MLMKPKLILLHWFDLRSNFLNVKVWVSWPACFFSLCVAVSGLAERQDNGRGEVDVSCLCHFQVWPSATYRKTASSRKTGPEVAFPKSVSSSLTANPRMMSYRRPRASETRALSYLPSVWKEAIITSWNLSVLLLCCPVCLLQKARHFSHTG